MTWLTQRIDEGSKTVEALLAEPAWAFDGRIRSRLPDEAGIYVISLRGSSESEVSPFKFRQQIERFRSNL